MGKFFNRLVHGDECEKVALRTVLIIAHRLSGGQRQRVAIARALLALGGLYRYLYDQQESRG